MQRGFAFKLMATKDIEKVLGMIGMHPAVTAENIEKPNAEIAANVYQNLAEFAYDMEIRQVKERAAEVPGVGQHMEIFDEAMDVVATLKLCRQLAFINRVEDFSSKDVWDPQAKRLRAILSGIINFCRYKESQTSVITEMKQEFHTKDSVRLELIDKSALVENELAEAQAQHSDELQDMFTAENELKEAQGAVDKLNKQKHAADRILEAAETKLAQSKDRLESSETRVETLNQNITSLQEQVAESPEGIEQEVKDLRRAIEMQKQRVEEKGMEKRSRTQRVHVLSQLQEKVDQYKGALQKVAESSDAHAVACNRSQAVGNELAEMRSALEARRAEEQQLLQSERQYKVDKDTAEQAHAQHVHECEERRLKAASEIQEINEKRSEEDRQWQALQQQRSELEAQIATITREHEAEMCDLEAQLNAVQHNGEAYVQSVEQLMAQYDVNAGWTGTSRSGAMGMKSPGTSRSGALGMKSPMSSARRRRGSSGGAFSSSPKLKTATSPAPAPRRLLMEKNGGY